MVGRTSIMAIIGGTFAKLGGGKFANGAMSAAFVHLFNYEYKDAVRTKRILEAKGYGKRGLYIEYGGHGKNSYYVKDRDGFIYGGYLPEEIKQAEGFGRAFDIGTKGYGKMVGRTSIMAIIGGTFAKLGGGKFANGAMSAAFVHLFNAEARFSWSVSGGAGVGGTYEKGFSIAYDTSKPWYKFFSNWSFQKYTTAGKGAFADISASTEINFGWSSLSDAKQVLGEAVVGGSSWNTTVLPENIAVGTEVTFPVQNGTKLYNISIGLDSPGGLPMESHAYKTNTTPGW